MKNLRSDNTGSYFDLQGTVGVWSMIVIYRSPSVFEDYKIVIYDGLEVFYNGSGAITDLDDDDDGIYDTQELCGTDPLPLLFTRDIEITIDLDEWENETSWELRGNGTLLASGNNYGNGSEIVTRTVTVNTGGNYTFTIFDSFGDGLNFNGGSDSNRTSGFEVNMDGFFGLVGGFNYTSPPSPKILTNMPI